jgi:cytochrome c-type biogenesis protein CcmE
MDEGQRPPSAAPQFESGTYAPDPLAPTTGRTRKRRTKFAVGGLVVLLAIGGLVVWALTRPGSTSFYMTVSEVAAGPPAATAQDFRVNGNVVPDTVSRDGVETTFEITDGSPNKLTIVTDDALPDAFWTAYESDASAIEVVAQGRLAADGSTFAATKVLAKCPSKFKTQT